MAVNTIPCAIIRGGTTKGVFINADHLPAEGIERDALILRLFGSPDWRQINGLGGGDPLTSKVALIKKSYDKSVDVEYQSGEVGIDEPCINYSTMCGNLASGAALFAINTGLIKAEYPIAKIVIKNVNTGKLIEAVIPIDKTGHPQLRNSCEDIDGVKGGGVEVSLTFIEPSGSITGHLLPSKRPIDCLEVDGNSYECSIVDCGTLYAFLAASQFNLNGDEEPESLDLNLVFKAKIEKIRDAVAKKISISIDKNIQAKQIKIAIYAAHKELDGYRGEIIARVVNKYKTHKAFPVTGAICMSAAAVIPNTLLNDGVKIDTSEHEMLVRHSEGVIKASTVCEIVDGVVRIKHTLLARSARIIMTGEAQLS